ncbi:hypothetical protein C8J56DRAFT_879955 [Mycena floridula]|nr:hypothetical protein C8J56DRAFT_879955 [Mycena floridula]
MKTKWKLEGKICRTGSQTASAPEDPPAPRKPVPLEHHPNATALCNSLSGPRTARGMIGKVKELLRRKSSKLSTIMSDLHSLPEHRCSKQNCKKRLPENYAFKTCQGPVVTFANPQSLFSALRDCLKMPNAKFLGSYDLDTDELVTDKQRIQMTAHEVWKAGDYHFRNIERTSGLSCRMWCCQDEARKQKEHRSTKEGAKQHDNVGMHRFHCQSQLNISCLDNARGGKTICINLQHAPAHQHYYHVAMPEAALAIIHDRVEHSTPSELIGLIQPQFPNVSAAQIYTAWSRMSETVWKWHEDQLQSARELLKDYPNNIDLFEDVGTDGVEQLCFGLKHILEGMRGKIIQTQNIWNSIQSWANMAMQDFLSPMYCLLTTATAVGISKRKKALEAWAKDIAEIGMARDVWEGAKIQLCWWHMQKAVEQRLAKVSTTPYKTKQAKRAHSCFPFIDPNFKPPGKSDKAEYEGDQLPGDKSWPMRPRPRDWALNIKIPPPTQGAQVTPTITIPARKVADGDD